MKMIFFVTILFAFILLLVGCNIAGGDMPEHYSREFLREKYESSELIDKVMKRQGLSEKEFFRLATYSNHAVDRMLGRNPACPEALLKKFSEHSGIHGWYVRRGVAENQNTPPELMRKLASDDNKYVRMSLAANPSLPEDVKLQFFKSKDVDAHSGLAMNPTTPPEMLRQIYVRYENFPMHKNRVTALNFAMNPKLPEDLAEKIYQKEKNKTYSLELDYLAMNPTVSPVILLKICEESKSTGKTRILHCRQNPNCPAKLKKGAANESNQ